MLIGGRGEKPCALACVDTDKMAATAAPKELISRTFKNPPSASDENREPRKRSAVANQFSLTPMSLVKPH
jgi:hypothetical protein